MAGKNGAAAYLTAEELDEIGAQLSMGDVWRVRQIEDEAERGAALYWQAAMRLKMHSGDLESFLDRVLERDFSKLVDASSRGRTAEGEESPLP